MATKKRVSFSEPSGSHRCPGAEVEGESVDEQSLEDYEDEQSGYLSSFLDPGLRPPTIPPRVLHCSDGTRHLAATSPVRKKISALQDRRVKTILIEALQLVDCSQEELTAIEKSVKKLRDAIYGFSILVDKQVNIIGAETLEERGRIRADIQDLAGNLKHSYEMFEATCDRVRATLTCGKQQIQLHKKRLGPSTPTKTAKPGSGSPRSPSKRSPGKGNGSPPRILPMNAPPTSPSVADGGISFSPACGRVPLMSLLEYQRSDKDDSGVPVFMTSEFFGSIMGSVGLDEKEFLDLKDLERFIQEMFTFCIAKSRALTFMGKAFHRRLIPTYTRDLVRMIAHELLLDTSEMGLVPQNTFSDYMCEPPFSFDVLLDRLYVTDGNHYTGEPSPVMAPMDIPAANPFSDHFTPNGGVLHDGRIVQALLVNRPDPEQLETAEQTLAMAKLLHDLATAESEAKHGSRLSIRSQPSRTNEFSRVYLAASKDLLSKETGVN